MTAVPPITTPTLVRLPTVRARTGLPTSSLYRLMQSGNFPRSVIIGPNARAWVLSEVEAWIAARVTARDTGADGDARSLNPAIGGRRKAARQHAA